MDGDEFIVEVVTTDKERTKIEKLTSEGLILSYSNPRMTEALRSVFVSEYVKFSLDVLDLEKPQWTVEKFYLDHNIVPWKKKPCNIEQSAPPQPIIIKKRAPPKCSKCSAIGHKKDSRACPFWERKVRPIKV